MDLLLPAWVPLLNVRKLCHLPAMLSTVTLGDLGDLQTGFNAAVSGAAGSRRRGGSRGFLQLSACSRLAWPPQGTARDAPPSLQLDGGQELGCSG